MIFVTACDSNYFDFLLKQVVNVKKHFGMAPVVYDLGLTETQQDVLDMLGVPQRNCPPHPPPGLEYPSGYVPKALYKPAVLLDAYDEWGGDIVWLDADARPVQPFEFPAKELGLTRVASNVLKAFQGTDLEKYTGPYHSGVMFLGKSDYMMRFLMGWARDLWNDPQPSDKKSLNRIILQENIGMYMSITEWHTDVFNSRRLLPQTKVLHER